MDGRFMWLRNPVDRKAGDELSVANDQEIYDRLTRVEEIIEQLDADE